MKTFSARLTAHRARLRAGIVDLAALAGVSTGTAWNWLHGISEPSAAAQRDVLAKLATVKAKDVKPCVQGRPRKARAGK